LELLNVISVIVNALIGSLFRLFEVVEPKVLVQNREDSLSGRMKNTGNLGQNARPLHGGFEMVD
jgi:hypothetical protein